MNKQAARTVKPKWPVLMTAGMLCLIAPRSHAEEAEAPPKGAAVTVLKASKFCFGNNVEVSGILLPREETAVRPERFGLKVAEVLVDAGETVSAGQVLARLNLPEGGSVQVQAPIAGTISNSTAVVGALASGKGEALFSIIARGEFDLVGMVPTRDIAKLQVNQAARIKILGAGEVDGKVRRLAPTVEPNSQLGQVFLGITTNRKLLVNASGRAHDQDRAELRRLGAAHRHPLFHRRHCGAGGQARPRRDAAGGNRLDVGGTGRDPRGHSGRRHRGRTRRGLAARGRPGAGGNGNRRREIGLDKLFRRPGLEPGPIRRGPRKWHTGRRLLS